MGGMCIFGETVHVKLPEKMKARRRWCKGVWLDKGEFNDEHIVGVEGPEGIIKGRSVKRFPGTPVEKDRILGLTGLPRSASQGTSHKFRQGPPRRQEHARPDKAARPGEDADVEEVSSSSEKEVQPRFITSGPPEAAARTAAP